MHVRRHWSHGLWISVVFRIAGIPATSDSTKKKYLVLMKCMLSCRPALRVSRLAPIANCHLSIVKHSWLSSRRIVRNGRAAVPERVREERSSQMSRLQGTDRVWRPQDGRHGSGLYFHLQLLTCHFPCPVKRQTANDAYVYVRCTRLSRQITIQISFRRCLPDRNQYPCMHTIDFI